MRNIVKEDRETNDAEKLENKGGQKNGAYTNDATLSFGERKA